LNKLITPWAITEQPVVEEIDSVFSEYSFFVIIIPAVFSIIHCLSSGDKKWADSSQSATETVWLHNKIKLILC
jgi:hypothetical protein